jgi:Cu/Ag efflux pump CusA
MISAIFVDRPRLAVVIAVVITLAGLLALLRIPVAQFPDIVPPQVVVSAVYPGASAEVVESSVGQPIEAQVTVALGAHRGAQAFRVSGKSATIDRWALERATCVVVANHSGGNRRRARCALRRL